MSMRIEDNRSGKFHASITDVRITKGKARYGLNWWRRLLLKVLGRSHFWDKKKDSKPASGTVKGKYDWWSYKLRSSVVWLDDGE